MTARILLDLFRHIALPQRRQASPPARIGQGGLQATLTYRTRRREQHMCSDADVPSYSYQLTPGPMGVAAARPRVVFDERLIVAFSAFADQRERCPG